MARTLDVTDALIPATPSPEVPVRRMTEDQEVRERIVRVSQLPIRFGLEANRRAL